MISNPMLTEVENSVNLSSRSSSKIINRNFTLANRRQTPAHWETHRRDVVLVITPADYSYLEKMSWSSS